MTLSGRPLRRAVQAAVVALALLASTPGVVSDGSAEHTRSGSRPGPAEVFAVVSQAPIRERLALATRLARNRDADLTVAVLDRATGAEFSNGSDLRIETASVAKLFIADDVLFRADAGELSLGRDDRALIDVMLRSSDDTAAQSLWSRFGRSDMVHRVRARYALSQTTIADGVPWWRTQTTMRDVATYYAALLDGRGGLPRGPSTTILGDISEFTVTGTDGYYQRFGLPDGLPEEPDIAVKQGWMCCVEGSWVHLSTGLVGADHRYVVAIGARESTARYGRGAGGADHARDTMTEAVAVLFPEGRIEL